MAKPTVLFVDDDLDMGELVTAALGARGFSVIIEPRADRAQDQLAHRHIDVVVTDLTLPGGGGTGLDLCRALHDVRPDLPVIILTGDLEAEPLAHEAGAAGFLAKPVSMTRLAETILAAAAGERPSVIAP